MTKAEQNETFHRLTIAAMIGSLENLDKILVKAEAHARESKIEPEVLLSARLYPDMFSLIQQLQYALYLPMDFARHFTDKPAPHVGYEEASFEDVHASLKTAIAYLKAIPASSLVERSQRVVPIFFDGTKGMPADDYAAIVEMPDFYFHLTIAYAILRHNGVPLSKEDFIGPYKSTPIE
jgi:uncharacterized protein